MSKKILLKTETDTISLAKQIASKINNRTIILLSGPLGSGKTFFTAHLCRFIGVNELVNSPSFVLVNRYQASNFPVYHIDLYRLNDPEEALQLGIEEFCDEGVVIIEWPQIIAFLFDDIDNNRTIIRLDFDYDGDNRSVTLA